MSQTHQTLGFQLRSARENIGLDLDQVSREQRIPKAYLDALEQGDFKALPGDVYTRSYLVSLSNRYSLSKDELLKLYAQESGSSAIAKNAFSNEMLSFNTNGESLRSSRSIPIGKITAFLVFIVLLFGGLKLLLNKPTQNTQVPLSSDSMNLSSESLVDSLAIASQGSPVKDSAKVEVKPETRVIINPKSADAAVLRIRYNEDSVVTYEIRQGLKPYEATFQDTVEIKISYPNRAELLLNDSAIASIPRGKYFKIYNGSLIQ